MPKYKVVIQYPNGATEEEDEIFDSEEDAVEYGDYFISCCRTGAETLNLSNPGDYPIDEYEEPDYEVIEIDE